MADNDNGVQDHQTRPCPCCGNDPCDLVLDLVTHRDWTVPGLMHLHPQRRELLAELIQEAIGVEDAGPATTIGVRAGVSAPSAPLPTGQEHLQAGGHLEAVAVRLSNLLTKLDTAICTCAVTKTDGEYWGVVSLGLLVEVSDMLDAVGHRFQAAAAADRAGAE